MLAHPNNTRNHCTKSCTQSPSSFWSRELDKVELNSSTINQVRAGALKEGRAMKLLYVSGKWKEDTHLDPARGHLHSLEYSTYQSSLIDLGGWLRCNLHLVIYAAKRQLHPIVLMKKYQNKFVNHKNLNLLERKQINNNQHVQQSSEPWITGDCLHRKVLNILTGEHLNITCLIDKSTDHWKLLIS